MSKTDDLTFSSFNMSFFCYEVSEVFFTYARGRWNPVEEEIARVKTATDATRFPNMKIGSDCPFQGPLKVRWRARDGAQLEIIVDLEKIFPEYKVLHTEPPERIFRPLPIVGEPTIIAELNDRTLNIYMLTNIQLTARDGGAGRERGVHRILAFSQTL